jgi:short-subunit dehydrogenase
VSKSSSAIITGASSGIGLELAKLLAADGNDLVLVARREKLLRDVADDLTRRYGIQASTVIADLGHPEGCSTVARHVETSGRVVTALVNNAGFGLLGPFAETPLERQLEMIDLNIAALTHLTRLLLPGMLSRRRGMILNVASTAAFQPGPLMSVYYASKAYVLSFSLALAVELEGSGVTVTTLCPGPTRTEFQEVAGMRGTLLANQGLAMSAERVARAGYRGMLHGKAIVTPGLLNRVMAVGTRLVPRMVAAKIAKKSQEARNK